MKLFNCIDEAYYINLDSRRDKMNLMENHLSDIGILNYVKRYSAITPKDMGFIPDSNGKYNISAGSVCCMESHVNLIKQAKKNNSNNILLFEDDALLYSDSGESPVSIITKAIEQIKQIPNWEVLYLGTMAVDSNLESFDWVSENLVKVQRAVGTHAILINHIAFDKIIENYKGNYAFDCYLSSDLFKNKYMVYPMAAIQRNGVANDLYVDVQLFGMDASFWKSAYNKPLKKLF